LIDYSSWVELIKSTKTDRRPLTVEQSTKMTEEPGWELSRRVGITWSTAAQPGSIVKMTLHPAAPISSREPAGTRRIGAACNAACNTHDTRISGFHALFPLATIITRRKNSGKPGFRYGCKAWREIGAKRMIQIVSVLFYEIIVVADMLCLMVQCLEVETLRWKNDPQTVSQGCHYPLQQCYHYV